MSTNTDLYVVPIIGGPPKKLRSIPLLIIHRSIRPTASISLFVRRPAPVMKATAGA